mmetsp:Transcript_10866/g.19018  ORF Transcript_10866/g.19018 Transcript_10866/m.19018 type:complete len:275 (+) Transcript_10866:1046-1870(+)
MQKTTTSYPPSSHTNTQSSHTNTPPHYEPPPTSPSTAPMHPHTIPIPYPPSSYPTTPVNRFPIRAVRRCSPTTTSICPPADDSPPAHSVIWRWHVGSCSRPRRIVVSRNGIFRFGGASPPRRDENRRWSRFPIPMLCAMFGSPLPTIPSVDRTTIVPDRRVSISARIVRATPSDPSRNRTQVPSVPRSFWYDRRPDRPPLRIVCTYCDTPPAHPGRTIVPFRNAGSFRERLPCYCVCRRHGRQPALRSIRIAVPVGWSIRSFWYRGVVRRIVFV